MFKKFYDEPLVEIISMMDDVIITSYGSDGFDDGWEDPNAKEN